MWGSLTGERSSVLAGEAEFPCPHGGTASCRAGEEATEVCVCVQRSSLPGAAAVEFDWEGPLPRESCVCLESIRSWSFEKEHRV